jgi:malic enzyme
MADAATAVVSTFDTIDLEDMKGSACFIVSRASPASEREYTILQDHKDGTAIIVSVATLKALKLRARISSKVLAECCSARHTWSVGQSLSPTKGVNRASKL